MRIIGLVILVVGAVFLGLGLFYTFSVAEKVVEGVSGQPENTTWFILGGLVMIMSGSGLMLLSSKKQK